MRKYLILVFVLLFSTYSLLAVNASGFPRDVLPPKCEICDVNGDGQVDVNDATLVAECFGSSVGMSMWNPTADVIPNGIIDISDIFFVASSFAA